MIFAMKFTYYRWNPMTGGIERIFSTEPRSYDLDLTGALIGTGEATIGAEENGGRAIANDIPITLSNTLRAVLPTGWDADSVIGSISGGTHGIAYPMLNAAGEALVVAVGVVYALYKGNEESRTMPEDIDPSLITGEINSYKEYLENVERLNVYTSTPTPENEDCITVIAGYIEPSTLVYDRYSESAQLHIIALDKLLRYIPQSALDLPATPNINEIITAITGRCPFIEGRELTALALGDFYWLVKALEYEWTPDDGLPEYSRFVYNRLLQWSLPEITAGSIHYMELQEGTNRYIDIDGATLSLVSTRPSRYAHVSTGTNLHFNAGDVASPDVHAWNPSLMWNTASLLYGYRGAGYDMGYTKAPYLPPRNSPLYTASNPLKLRARGFVCISQLHGFTPSLAVPVDLICYLGFVYRAGASSYLAMFAPWNETTNNWDSISHPVFPLSIPRSDTMPESIQEGLTFVWRYGWKRIWMVDESRTQIYSYPSPESGVRNATIRAEPKLHSGNIVIHYNASGEMDGYIRGFAKAKIYTIAPHLGNGDIEDFLITDEGGSYELKYRLYPTYFNKDNERVGVRLYSEATGALATGFDYYGVGVDYADLDTFLECYKDILAGGSEGMQKPPDDLPLEPVFVYDIRNRLEIWYYSDGWLHCYNWKMELKYDYRIGVPEDRICLGRDADGKLICAITTKDGIVTLKHESTDTPTWLVVDSGNDDTAESILNNIVNQSFGAWWVDRKNGSTRLMVKNRYMGDVRGKVGVLSHSYESDVEDSQEAPPNRVLTREYWDTYADHIDVKDSKGRIMATAGREKSIYNYTYELKDVYHKQLGQRIANKLLEILGQRRELLKVPFHAWRAGAYDFVNLYGRNYCVLTQKTDFSKTLRTDIECINLDMQRIDSGLLNCALKGFYNFQGGDWSYDADITITPSCVGSSCDSCDIEQETFIGAVLALLNRYWRPESAVDAPGSAAVESDIISEIEELVFEHWLDPIEGTDETLSSLYENYYNCVVNHCGWVVV